MKIGKCEDCGNEYHFTKFKNCACGGLLFEAASKAKPRSGLLQRRVGRSASGGKPEAVARLVGRKKANQNPVAFTCSIRGMTRAQLAKYLRESISRWIDFGALSGNSLGDGGSIRWRIDEDSDAASRRRQRAIPANAEISERRPGDSLNRIVGRSDHGNAQKDQ